MSTHPPKIITPLKQVGPPDIELTIGKLDRMLSEFLYCVEHHDLNVIDAHTLKHHADDLIGVGTHALKKLEERGSR